MANKDPAKDQKHFYFGTAHMLCGKPSDSNMGFPAAVTYGGVTCPNCKSHMGMIAKTVLRGCEMDFLLEIAAYGQ